MKKRQNSDRIIFYKKINIFKKTNPNKTRLDNNNRTFLYPMIIKIKKYNFQNSPGKFTSYTNTNNKYEYSNFSNKDRINNIFNLINNSPNTQEKQIQTNILPKNIDKINKDKKKQLLMKKISKFLFSKKLKTNFEKTSLSHISNYSNINNSFNTSKYKSIPNIKYSIKNEKSILTTKKISNFVKNNYITNLTKFNHQVFKYHLFKRKRKFDQLLYDIKKSEVIEEMKINQDLAILKAKSSNSKHKKPWGEKVEIFL